MNRSSPTVKSISNQFDRLCYYFLKIGQEIPKEYTQDHTGWTGSQVVGYSIKESIFILQLSVVTPSTELNLLSSVEVDHQAEDSESEHQGVNNIS